MRRIEGQMKGGMMGRSVERVVSVDNGGTHDFVQDKWRRLSCLVLNA